MTIIELRDKIALSLLNERVRFFNTGRKFTNSLTELEPHQYRDQLRQADAIIADIGLEAPDIPITRGDYSDEIFSQMTRCVTYATNAIGDNMKDAETIAENAVDNILKIAVEEYYRKHGKGVT